MNEVIQVVLGVGLFLLLMVLVFIAVLLARAISKVNTLYQNVDRALVPFGQTGWGRLFNQGVRQGRGYVDQPTDALIIRMTDLISSVTLLKRVADSAGIELSYDKVAVWGRAIFDALDNMTDGMPEPDNKV